jgi:hypothetical protein
VAAEEEADGKERYGDAGEDWEGGEVAQEARDGMCDEGAAENQGADAGGVAGGEGHGQRAGEGFCEEDEISLGGQGVFEAGEMAFDGETVVRRVFENAGGEVGGEVGEEWVEQVGGAVEAGEEDEGAAALIRRT